METKTKAAPRQASPQRWTPSRIRSATPFPRPRGARAEAIAYRGGGAARDLASLERRLLRAIISKADLLGPVTKDELGREERWLLVPAQRWMLDLMAVFEVEREDLEDGHDAEDDGCGEEPSLGSSEDVVDQSLWAAGFDSLEPDREEEGWDDEDGDDAEPDPEDPRPRLADYVRQQRSLAPGERAPVHVRADSMDDPALGKWVPL
jgi:hypothetical protein